MSRPIKILHLTSSEQGQANVHLAVAHALVQQDPSTEIHIGSTKKLDGLVREASEHAFKSIPGASPFHFHEICGPSYGDCLSDPSIDFLSVAAIPPVFRNSLSLLKGLANCSVPWTPEQFLDVYRDTVRVINSVDPDMVVVDSGCCPALTACRYLKRNWLVLSPNSLKDLASSQQPKLRGLWKYPK